MRIATLDLTPELFIEFCKASKENNHRPRRFVVKKNPLPDDAKVVRVGVREPYPPATLRLFIESATFEAVAEGTEPPELEPTWYETVFDTIGSGREADFE